MFIILNHEQDTLTLGRRLAQFCPDNCLIFLQGSLGAGKTTLVRGFLQELNFLGKVKSPTYSLVENYQCGNKTVLHFDLYRLQHPLELEAIGIRDYLSFNAIWLIEWPDKASYPAQPNTSTLPQADLNVSIGLKEEGRIVQLESLTQKGKSILNSLALFYP